jgi:hypothetical protein
MQDANAVLQVSVTKTADFDSAGFDLKTGTPRRGLKARVLITAIGGTSPTHTFSIQDSDNDSTYATIATGAVQSAVGESFIPFETSKRYIRLSADIAASANPSATYQAHLLLARP